MPRALKVEKNINIIWSRSTLLWLLYRARSSSYLSLGDSAKGHDRQGGGGGWAHSMAHYNQAGKGLHVVVCSTSERCPIHWPCLVKVYFRFLWLNSEMKEILKSQKNNDIYYKKIYDTSFKEIFIKRILNKFLCSLPSKVTIIFKFNHIRMRNIIFVIESKIQ